MISSKLNSVFSDIRGPLFYRALAKEQEGEKVLKLNTGNPAAFGFKMPDSLRKALLENADRAVGYCDLRGMKEARLAITEYHKGLGVENVDFNDVYITNGVSEAASLIISAICDDDDEFLVPTPCYSLWVNCIRLTGGKTVFYNCVEENGWMPDLADMEKKITPKTKAILIINPNNPTGAVYSRETVQGIYDMAKKHNLMILSDEIYDRLVFDGVKHTPTATLGNDVPMVSFNGLSKSHCVCGFRCGWMIVSGPDEAKKALNTALTTLTSIRLCSNALMQLVIPAALEDSAYTEEMISEGGRLYEQRRAAIEGLNAIDGVSVVPNYAAFYLFPKIDIARFGFESDKDFAAQLLEETNILIVAGSGFYCNDKEHFRVVALPEADQLRDMFAKMAAFLKARDTKK